MTNTATISYTFLGAKTRLLLASLVIFAFAGFSIGFTSAAFQASDSIGGNSVTTGVWSSTGSILITKYLCPEGTSVNRDDNGVGGEVPDGCELQAGATFGYVHGSAEDPFSPWPELDVTPMTVGGTTNASGSLLISDLEAAGRYLVAETDDDGYRLPHDEILGLYCEGDGDTDPNHNDNHELTFVPANGVANCVAYNEALAEVPTETSETIVASPSDMQGWFFAPENTVGSQSGQMIAGPASPPVGTGSAQFVLTASTEGEILVTEAHKGTRLADIVELKYSTYRTSGNPAYAASLGFEFDNDLGDADTTFKGRLTYEPYLAHTVSTGAWQEWNTRDNAAAGNWWFSNGAMQTAANTASGCGTMGNPCTWAEVLNAFPNGGIRDAGALTGFLLFKAGGGWTSFDGNVDKLVIGIQSGLDTHTTTYDFEPEAAEPVPGPGDVVINEIMWTGSFPGAGGATEDEWIELRNMTASAIDLAGWSIENLGTNPTPTITIPSGTLPAGGYFLIGNNASNDSAIANSITVNHVTTGVQLLNSGEQLTLRDASSVVIDQTPTGSWAAGDNTGAQRKSMERNLVPGTGTLAASWHTCIDPGCTTTTFWDVAGANYGTPGAANLSENDPTAPDYIPKDWSYTVGWEPDENDEIDDSERELLELLEQAELENALLDDTATTTATTTDTTATSTATTTDETTGGGGGGGGASAGGGEDGDMKDTDEETGDELADDEDGTDDGTGAYDEGTDAPADDETKTGGGEGTDQPTGGEEESKPEDSTEGGETDGGETSGTEGAGGSEGSGGDTGSEGSSGGETGDGSTGGESGSGEGE